MCGIAGIWNFNEKVALSDLKAFTDSMEHRGPDGSGYELLNSDTLGLGHRRLSILDLSENGKQPMVFGEFTIVYNGEIFNFLELKEELEILGHSFKTKTDTEVLLASYKEWGEDAFHKWNGMWAFALYDSRKEELLLSCDRFGIKPCYYSYEEDKKRFSFASETYAFGFLMEHKKEFNEDNIILELDNPYVIEPLGYTIYSNICRLLPGHTIRLKKGENPEQIRWYDINSYIKEFQGTFEDAKKKFRELIIDATKLRLRSDVPIATALSGGLDSSTVMGIIKHLSSKNIALERALDMEYQSYTMTFPDWEKDEKKDALEVLAFHKATGKFVEVNKENFSKRIFDSTKKSDFLMSDSLLGIIDLYGAMSKDGVKVSLDGHGVDEMLFGYKNMIWELHDSGLFDRKLLQKQLLSMYPDSEKEKIKKYFELFHKREGLLWKFLLKIKTIKENRSNPPISLSNEPYSWSKSNGKSIALNYFFNGSLIPILRNFDKASMISNIEVRMPFMDFRIVEFCFSLPINFLLNGEFTKLILRESCAEFLPESTKNRNAKLGFQTPIETWMEELVKNDFDYLKEDPIYKKVLNHWRKKELNTKDKWRLLNLAILNTNGK